MRKILLLIFTCTVLACSAHAVKTAPMPESDIYTYDGEYDVAIFFNWDRLKTYICPEGHHHLLMGNPSEEPKLVMLITVKLKDEYFVIGYSYFKDGVRYVFAMDRAIRHYMQMQPKQSIPKNLRRKK